MVKLHIARCLVLPLIFIVLMLATVASGQTATIGIKITPQFRTLADCRAAADAGDARAMLEMAWRYEQGREVRRSAEDALQWLRKSADAGDSDAQFYLARHLLQDGADDATVREAVSLFGKAAAQDHPEAAYEFALALLEGRGIEEDAARANDYLLLAAEAGTTAAQAQYGLNHLHGRGVPMDEEKALAWLRRAADRNHPEAQRQLGWMYKLGRGVPQDHRQGMQWILKAAAQNHGPAQWDAGVILKNGDGVPVNLAQAERWFRRLSEQNHFDAQVELASFASRTYQRLTQPLRWRGSQIVNEINSPVRVSGYLTDGSGDEWIVDSGKGIVQIDASRIESAPFGRGLYVDLFGPIADDGMLHALVWNLPEPRLAWTHRIELPEILRANYNQTIRVTGTLTNSGLQPIKRAELHIRLSQLGSSNTVTQTVVFETLMPGETRAFEQNFSSFSIRDSYHASIPRAEVVGQVVDW